MTSHPAHSHLGSVIVAQAFNWAWWDIYGLLAFHWLFDSLKRFLRIPRIFRIFYQSIPASVADIQSSKVHAVYAWQILWHRSKHRKWGSKHLQSPLVRRDTVSTGPIGGNGKASGRDLVPSPKRIRKWRLTCERTAIRNYIQQRLTSSLLSNI